jgi:hypothetical protein
MSYLRLGSSLILLCFAAAACGTSDKPGSSVTAPSAASATVSGTIVAAAGTPPNISTGTTVRVVGTDITTTVDANQSFTLTNVPGNSNVVLQFIGTGLDTQANLGLIHFADNVVLVLFRTNSTLTLTGINGSTPPSAGSTTITGQISFISSLSSTAPQSFTVLGQTIFVDPVTQFLRPDGTLGTFLDLFVGLGVRVTVVPGPSGAVIARVVQILSTNAGVTVVLHVTIVDLTGNAQSFSFTAQGQTVRGDQTTTFENGRTFSALGNGVTVEITGIVRNGFVQATRIRVP